MLIPAWVLLLAPEFTSDGQNAVNHVGKCCEGLRNPFRTGEGKNKNMVDAHCLSVCTGESSKTRVFRIRWCEKRISPPSTDMAKGPLALWPFGPWDATAEAFGVLWRNTAALPERFFSKPRVRSPPWVPHWRWSKPSWDPRLGGGECTTHLRT